MKARFNTGTSTDKDRAQLTHHHSSWCGSSFMQQTHRPACASSPMCDYKTSPQISFILVGKQEETLRNTRKDE
jgi:hypothetical protein